jgi:hypothetical protein
MSAFQDGFTRRLLLVVCALSVSGSLQGCSTSKTPVQFRFSYTERIRAILAVPERSQLVILGDRYQYLFDDKASVGRATHATFQSTLSGSFGIFAVYPDNRISGNYRVHTSQPLSDEQREEALRLGFAQTDDGRFELSSELSGHRYTTSPVATDVGDSNLPPSFTISVDVWGEPPVKSGSSTSPAMKALDTVGLVLLAPFIAVGFLFVNPCITCK